MPRVQRVCRCRAPSPAAVQAVDDEDDMCIYWVAIILALCLLSALTTWMLWSGGPRNEKYGAESEENAYGGYIIRKSEYSGAGDIIEVKGDPQVSALKKCECPPCKSRSTAAECVCRNQVESLSEKASKCLDNLMPQGKACCGSVVKYVCSCARKPKTTLDRMCQVPSQTTPKLKSCVSFKTKTKTAKPPPCEGSVSTTSSMGKSDSVASADLSNVRVSPYLSYLDMCSLCRIVSACATRLQEFCSQADYYHPCGSSDYPGNNNNYPYYYNSSTCYGPRFVTYTRAVPPRESAAASYQQSSACCTGRRPMVKRKGKYRPI